jgi:hypothetical protein
MVVQDELVCYAILPYGLDGCPVAFAAMEYAVGEKIFVSYPPPHLCIIIVGCPNRCGNILLLEQSNHGIGIYLRLHMMVQDKLACYAILPYGSDGCPVAFAAMEYAVGDRELCLDCTISKLVDVILPNNKNRMVDAFIAAIMGMLLEKSCILQQPTIKFQKLRRHNYKL